jgi:crossover junction endodeoxyribonuclease RusA
LIVLTLPFPISVNAMYADGKTRRHKSQRYADWIAEAGWVLKGQRPPQIKGKFRIEYVLQDNIDRRERDAFNYEKGVTDLLVEHGVIEKDSNRCLRWGSIGWDETNSVKGVRITITPIAGEEHDTRRQPDQIYNGPY